MMSPSVGRRWGGGGGEGGREGERVRMREDYCIRKYEYTPSNCSVRKGADIHVSVNKHCMHNQLLHVLLNIVS